MSVRAGAHEPVGVSGVRVS